MCSASVNSGWARMLGVPSTMTSLAGAVSKEGATLVPLEILFNQRGMAKVVLGLAEGKNKADKRAAIADREWKRDKARLMRDRG